MHREGNRAQSEYWGGGNSGSEMNGDSGDGKLHVLVTALVLNGRFLGGSASLAAAGQAAMTAASAVSNGKNVPNPKRRVLAADENVWKAQSRWKTAGRFLLENRRETVHSTLEKVRRFLRDLESAKQKFGPGSDDLSETVERL